MVDLVLIREALRDPTIAAYPDFTDAVTEACDELDAARVALVAVGDWINRLPIPTSGATRMLGVVRAASAAKGCAE